MPESRQDEFRREFARIKQASGYPHEVGWKKKNNKKYLGCFLDLVDFFFEKEWLAFHCLIVRKGDINKEFHGGDYDLARRKFYTELIALKAQRCADAHPGPRNSVLVLVDPIASRNKRADQCMRAVANHMLGRSRGLIEDVRTVDSKLYPEVQLSDLLAGVVNDSWTHQSSSEEGRQIRSRLLSHIGWAEMSDTHPSERKFNIWYFWDKARGQRQVETQAVRLRCPLPQRSRRHLRRAAGDRYRRSAPNAQPVPTSPAGSTPCRRHGQ